MTKRHLNLIIIIISGLLPLSNAFANEKTRLVQLNSHIESIQADLKNASHKKHTLQKSLKKTELAESHLTNKLNKIHLELNNQKKRLSALNKKAEYLTTEISQDKAYLKKQIKAAYFLSRQPAAKYLLDTKSIQEYQRTLTYFHYFTKQQVQTINHLQSTFQQYKDNKTAQENTLAMLLNTRKNLQQNQQSLKQTQETRQQLIQHINQQIRTKKQKLAKLLNDKQRLQNTLANLNKSQLKENLFKHPFDERRGHLLWPTKGRLQNHFGAQIAQSELTWEGVLIDAKPGQPVRAVAPGKVIFSKWLQGYGLLLIIDHGKGYMTLYGRNQTLVKKTGDWVDTNTVIATAGQTGGFSESALYFSIRHNAKPLNPEKWCH